MCRNREALMPRFLRLDYDVTAFLMNSPVSQASAEGIDEIVAG